MSVEYDGICAVVNTAATRASIKNAHRGILLAAGVGATGIGDIGVFCVDGGDVRGRHRRDGGSASTSEFLSEVAVTLPEGTTEEELGTAVATAVEEGVPIEITDAAGNMEIVQVHSVTASTVLGNDGSVAGADEPEQDGGSPDGSSKANSTAAGAIAGGIAAALAVAALAVVGAVLYVRRDADRRAVTPRSSLGATVENTGGFFTARRSSSLVRRRSSYAELETGEVADICSAGHATAGAGTDVGAAD